MIKCFVINLDHRKDRLKRIRKHLNSNGLYFTRFQAVNALETNSKTLTRNITQYGPLGKISIGDMACFQSHLMLWKKIYKTEKKPVLVLEDDACISKRGFELLRSTNWIPKNAKIIKCEKFGNKRHRVLLSPKLKSIYEFHLHYLMSKHSGTGGYIITPNGAKYLVEKSINVNVPVDHFLFNPSNSEIFWESQATSTLSSHLRTSSSIIWRPQGDCQWWKRNSNSIGKNQWCWRRQVWRPHCFAF